MDSPNENIFEQELEALQNFIVDNENVAEIINEPDTVQRENNVQPIASVSDLALQAFVENISDEIAPLLNNNVELVGLKK